jgi:NitT/TauT family transport system substrate-binding protein
MLEAIEQMEADGYDIETPFLAETELCIDGLTRDDFQVGTLFPASLAAVQAGADNIPMVAVRSLNANLIVAQSGLTTCDDLDGRSFAIHSTGSFMAALFRLWRDRECSPDTEISEIVIPGSGSRTQALIAGEVDSTGVELQDEATLTLNYGGQYEVLERFAETEPQIVAFGVNVNRDFLEEQPDAVRALIRHMTLAARTWAADPAAFAEAIDRHLPDLDPAVASFYVEELGAGTFFPLNGNVTEDALAYTIQLFQDAGVISEPIPVEAVADLGPLRDVLGELGVELELQNAASS